MRFKEGWGCRGGEPRKHLSRALRVKNETSISENLVRDIRSPLDERGRRFFFKTGVYKETHKAKKCDFFAFLRILRILRKCRYLPLKIAVEKGEAGGGLPPHETEKWYMLKKVKGKMETGSFSFHQTDKWLML